MKPAQNSRTGGSREGAAEEGEIDPKELADSPVKAC